MVGGDGNILHNPLHENKRPLCVESRSCFLYFVRNTVATAHEEIMKRKTSARTPQQSITTRAIHGTKLFAYKGPLTTPIFQTSTYRFESSEDAIRFAKGDPRCTCIRDTTIQRCTTSRKNSP
jgi:hypothetical protein